MTNYTANRAKAMASAEIQPSPGHLAIFNALMLIADELHEINNEQERKSNEKRTTKLKHPWSSAY